MLSPPSLVGRIKVFSCMICEALFSILLEWKGQQIIFKSELYDLNWFHNFMIFSSKLIKFSVNGGLIAQLSYYN
jgi:hypothetical protein